MLSSPSGILRQACVRSHSNSSHPLQCRALELCFSVALDRLPSSTASNSDSSTSSVTEPPISNALLASLKRAQAHQRRGSPEQQPLLAVKVELGQLVLSILDDPSVSRVMREASFSSPSVKANIEQSLSVSTNSSSSNNSTSQIPFLSPSHSSSAATSCGTNPYCNPHFHVRPDEVKRVLEIMARCQKRNPVLVGDSGPRPILREVLRRIESGADPLVPSSLRCAQVISLEKDFAECSRISARIRELGASIEARTGEVSVVIDLGDLKFLVEGGSAQHQQPAVATETALSAVVEMAKLLTRINNGGCHRMWFVGLATCATYLRCQVYHPSVEDNWDLQAAPIVPRSPLSHLFPRLGANGILGTIKDPWLLVRSFADVGVPQRVALSLESSDSSRKSSLCSLCIEDYERELAKLVEKEFERSSSSYKKDSLHLLPSWLQMAKEQNHFEPKERELKWNERSAELIKRWQENCSKLHPHSTAVLIDRKKPAALSVSPALPLPPKLTNTRAIPALQTSSLERAASSHNRPVKTDLVLGQSKPSSSRMAKVHRDRVQDSAGCRQDNTDPRISELDTFKRLFHGLTERVGWQPEAASVIATAVVQCKSGNGKTRPIDSKGSIWLLFDGSDKVGKLKMAAALSELMFGTTPITVRLGRASPSEKKYFDSDTVLRGKTSMDRVAEALYQNPFSVIVIEDINSASNMDKITLTSAMKTGRVPDSHGREISLENAIFVLLTNDPSLTHYEEKILESAGSGWLLEFAILEGEGKRQAEGLCKDERSLKRSRESLPGLSFDLNLAISTEDGDNGDPAEGCRNSSNLTVEHEHKNEPKKLVMKKLAEPTVAPLSWAITEIPKLIDEMVLFQPVDFTSVKRKVTEFIRSKFNVIIGHEHSIRIEEDALGLWLAGAGIRWNGLEEWAEKMLVPSIHQLKTCLKATIGPVTVQLIAKKAKRDVGTEFLPAVVSASSITVNGL